MHGERPISDTIPHAAPWGRSRRYLLLTLSLYGTLLNSAFATNPGQWPAGDAVTVPLFDGNSLQHWQTLDGAPPSEGWEMVEGELHLVPREGGPGALVTRAEFDNFRLDFAWTIAPKGNNGIKYRVRDYQGRVLGCEYQIIDDHTFPEPLRANQTTGALYDLYPPSPTKILHPAGELNYGAIVVQGQTVEHWLNGQRVVQAQIGDADWQSRVAASKFNDVPEFSVNPSGKIMITDHHSEVWFRYLLLTPLSAPQTTNAITCTHAGQIARACPSPCSWNRLGGIRCKTAWGGNPGCRPGRPWRVRWVHGAGR